MGRMGGRVLHELLVSPRTAVKSAEGALADRVTAPLSIRDAPYAISSQSEYGQEGGTETETREEAGDVEESAALLHSGEPDGRNVAALLS